MNERKLNKIWAFDLYRLDSAKRALLCGGKLVSLQPKAMEILLVLIHRRGEVVSKDELMQAVWRDTFVEESNLSQSVFVLRRALGERASENRHIATIPGRGYSFVANVKEVAEGNEEATETRNESDESRNSSPANTYFIEFTRPGDSQSLCRTCYWAHAQKGFREREEAIFCVFGPMREVPFPVRGCTDYMNRALPIRALTEKIALNQGGLITRMGKSFAGRR